MEELITDINDSLRIIEQGLCGKKKNALGVCTKLNLSGSERVRRDLARDDSSHEVHTNTVMNNIRICSRASPSFSVCIRQRLTILFLRALAISIRGRLGL